MCVNGQWSHYGVDADIIFTTCMYSTAKPWGYDDPMHFWGRCPYRNYPVAAL